MTSGGVGLPEQPRRQGSAILSDDGVYRYSLNRWWDNSNETWDLWIMLNPSTADASVDDPTIRRCMGFSRGWGSGGLTVVNLYGYRATQPKAMFAAQKAGADIVGPDCDGWIKAHSSITKGRIVAAWGAHADPARVWHVSRMLLRDYEMTSLGITKDGHPRHPLYVKADTELARWAA